MPYGYEFIISTERRPEPINTAAVAANLLTQYLPNATVIEATLYDDGAGVGLLVRTEEEIVYEEAMEEMDSLETMEVVLIEFEE